MDTASLERDVARLSDALWSAVTTLGGDAARALCGSLGALATQLRDGQVDRAAFRARIEALSNEALEDVARPYALWCHLSNSAEERQRLRTLRARGDRAPDGLAAAIDGLIDSGMGEDELRVWFDRALVMPVITAHPTEARRRSSLDHLARLQALLDDFERTGRSRSEAAVAAEVLALQATEDARARRPTPLDEVEYALDVFRRSLLDVTPRIYRTIEERVRARFGATWRIPSFFRWGSW
ncbi:MAG TPA: phosphoenolpyruvate carboxylase, partial [Kofleriaceae bacterium]|nr:phosphoenolpyruvate carboxylase [Kofleriaceae bacterium]